MNHLFTAIPIVLLVLAANGFAGEAKQPNLTLVWPDGTKYIGGVLDGKRDGEGTIYWTDGTRFTGQFKDDLRNGPGSMILPDGTVHSGYFVDDNLVDPPTEETATQQTATKQLTGHQTDDTEQQVATPARQDTEDSEAQSVTSRKQTETPTDADSKTKGKDKQVALIEQPQKNRQHVPVTLLTDNIRLTLTYTIDLWAAAWSTQNTDLYLAMYHSDFEVPGKLTRRQWEVLRTSRLKKPKSIDVSVAYDRFEIIKPDTAEVTFKQTYKSNLYRDATTKVLILALTEDGWKIVTERTEISSR
jgi:hypothetical protein